MSDFSRWIDALERVRVKAESINPPPDVSYEPSPWERALLLQMRAGKKPV